MTKTFVKKFICILLSVCVLMLTGCRYSPVIEEIILDQVRAEDINEDFVYDDSEDADEMSDELPDMSEYDLSEREAESVQGLAAYDADSDNNSGSGGLASYKDDSSTTNTPAGSPSDLSDFDDDSDSDPSGGDDSGSNTVDLDFQEYAPEEESQGDINGNDNPSSQGTGDSGGNVDDDQDGGNPEQGGSDSSVDIYGDNGSDQKTPGNVYGVAAVGNTAIAVMMIGGIDVLKATNENLLAHSAAAWEVYGSRISSDIGIAWTGDGDNGVTNIDVILDNDDINLVVVTSGENTLTEEQAAKIREVKGENSILTLPRITSVSTAKTVANILGSALGNGSSNGSGVNAIARANAYCNWIDSNVSALGRTYYTLYVDDWDSTASYSMGTGTDGSSISGYGAAVIQFYKDSSQSVVSGMLKDIGVYNCTSLSEDNMRTGKYLYSPWYPQGCANLSSSYYAATNVNDLFDIPYSIESGEGVGYLIDYNSENMVGKSNFPVIIAGNQAAKKGLQSNYLWSTKSYISSGLGGYGVVADGNLCLTFICYQPEYVTNPYGITSWTESSLESVLETVWFKAVLTGNGSDCYNSVKSFYSQFYDYDLSSSLFNQILAGR